MGSPAAAVAERRSAGNSAAAARHGLVTAGTEPGCARNCAHRHACNQNYLVEAPPVGLEPTTLRLKDQRLSSMSVIPYRLANFQLSKGKLEPPRRSIDHHPANSVQRFLCL